MAQVEQAQRSVRSPVRQISLSLSLVLVIGCRDQSLVPLTNALQFEPASIEFETVFADGKPREVTVDVVNIGQSKLPVIWSQLEAPFSADLPDTLQPGLTTLTLRWLPDVPGRYSRVLEVESTGVEAATLFIEAAAKEMPSCQPSSPCVTARFDSEAQTCVEDLLPDGISCNSGSLCLEEARCEAGRCVGKAKTCDDGNLCTTDVCYPLTGCEFLPAPPCPGDGMCLEGVCDPKKGCGLQPRSDGSSCGGQTASCTAVNVCIDGACVVRDPPDGYVCSEASPCVGEGRCVNDVCVKPFGFQLVPGWAFDALAELPENPPQLHDFVMEASGKMSLSGFFHVGSRLRANTPEARIAPLGGSRRCILWNERYVCADYPATPNGKVSAIDLATGLTDWTLDIRTARPDFLAAVSTIFLARLVVQDSDRLAAVFEAYPKNETNDTQCRRYFLAVINAKGQLVQAQAIEDPLLTVCNHPHPYGVVADANANLFIAFSPSASQQAPLVPDNTTLLMSYSRDGVFRWKRLNEGMRGGELAVAKGLLYAEYAAAALDGTSGDIAFTLPQQFGRAVVSSSRLVPAPQEGALDLNGYEAGHAQQRWSRQLPEGWAFWSDQIRLARWDTSKGARTVALTFLKNRFPQTQALMLYGVDIQDGSEAFMCPIDVPARTPPQLFEVAAHQLGIMNGALDATGSPACSKCDPPLAGSSAAFFTLQTPGLSPVNEPWVGTFGGPGHDHREDNAQGLLNQ